MNLARPLLFAAGTIVLVLVGLAIRRPTQIEEAAVSGKAILHPAADLAQARVSTKTVFERPDGIYLTEDGSDPVLVVPGATYPRWFPDGETIACLRDGWLLRVSLMARRTETLCEVEKPRAVNVHPNGEEVLFTNGREVRAYNIATKDQRTLVAGYSFYEIDLSADGSRLAATVKGRAGVGFEVRAFDLSVDASKKIASGCSAGLPLDGSLVSTLKGDHRELLLWSWETGKVVSRIHAPQGSKFDNHSWSHDPDWIASQSENGPDLFAHHIPSGTTYRLAAIDDANRPDLHVRRLADD